MTADEARQIREIQDGVGRLLEGIRHLCLRDPHTTPADLRAQLAHQQETLARLVEVVQIRLNMAWERARASTPVSRAPIVARPPESSDLEPDRVVTRHGPNGRPLGADTTPPPLQGRRATGQHRGIRPS